MKCPAAFVMMCILAFVAMSKASDLLYVTVEPGKNGARISLNGQPYEDGKFWKQIGRMEAEFGFKRSDMMVVFDSALRFSEVAEVLQRLQPLRFQTICTFLVEGLEGETCLNERIRSQMTQFWFFLPHPPGRER